MDKRNLALSAYYIRKMDICEQVENQKLYYDLDLCIDGGLCIPMTQYYGVGAPPCVKCGKKKLYDIA